MSDVVAISELSEPELLEALASKPTDYYLNLKDLPDPIAKKIYPDLKKRWDTTEARIKPVETALTSLKYDDRSLEEDRVEILGELLDKACQGFEIYDEHERRRIAVGHRLVLEARLLILMNKALDRITKICDEFDNLRGDKHAVDNEREMLRYEIRFCDDTYVEVHERFLKSYLGMEW
ncbi:Protein Y53F4B.11 [Aphelenchoides avenae]|nr:Protein Y53F4B.11 [Aphelenchus avenae]